MVYCGSLLKAEVGQAVWVVVDLVLFCQAVHHGDPTSREFRLADNCPLVNKTCQGVGPYPLVKPPCGPGKLGLGRSTLAYDLEHQKRTATLFRVRHPGGYGPI